MMSHYRSQWSSVVVKGHAARAGVILTPFQNSGVTGLRRARQGGGGGRPFVARQTASTARANNPPARLQSTAAPPPPPPRRRKWPGAAPVTRGHPGSVPGRPQVTGTQSLVSSAHAPTGDQLCTCSCHRAAGTAASAINIISVQIDQWWLQVTIYLFHYGSIPGSVTSPNQPNVTCWPFLFL